jgi:hypothetical protein
MTEWQPIESVPRDGTVVDCWCGGQRSASCFWEPDPLPEFPGEGEWRQMYSEAYGSSFSLMDFSPTHWMPLPAPPA